MRTSQLFVQDSNTAVTTLFSLRFDSCKAIATKRTPTLRPTLANPTLKNPKHAAVLAESGINYDTPMNPTQVATIRAERIAKEKKQNQAVSKHYHFEESPDNRIVKNVFKRFCIVFLNSPERIFGYGIHR